jgi:hypothetical protein
MIDKFHATIFVKMKRKEREKRISAHFHWFSSVPGEQSFQKKNTTGD